VQIPGDGAVHAYAARVPIAVGGRLALDGAAVPLTFTTGAAAAGYGLVRYATVAADTFLEDDQHGGQAPAAGRLLLAADVETDFDGDGYGDVTQDGCVNDATDHTALCTLARTFGSALTLAPDRGGFPASVVPVGAFQSGADWTVPGVIVPGVLTTWRFRADPAAGRTVLQLLRPGGSGTYTVIAESPATAVASNAITELPAQIPVRSNDVIAARAVAPGGGGAAELGAVAPVAGDLLVTRQPPALLGDTWTPGAGGVAFRLLAQADVEPDADGDGKGDLTQDRADLVVTGSAPAEVAATEGWSHVYTVRNAGPDTAQSATVRLGGGASSGSGSAGVRCDNPPNGANASCDLPSLAPGASVTVTAGFIEPAIYPPLAGTRASVATVTALTTDPVPGNNSASLSTAVRAATPPMQVSQPPFVVKPCVNVIRGTRDDDVLRGTAFGDRLVGNDGDDLLKGSGAGDCLEGGAGNDVLDGGDGDDRLAGSSGKDRLTGGKGDDKLTGGRGNDRLGGGAGKDTIASGSGKDSVTAGSGNDTINAVDGVRETIDCGPGKDTIRADRRDRLKGCEKVTRR
jgi:hypothetical protein